MIQTPQGLLQDLWMGQLELTRRLRMVNCLAERRAEGDKIGTLVARLECEGREQGRKEWTLQ